MPSDDKGTRAQLAYPDTIHHLYEPILKKLLNVVLDMFVHNTTLIPSMELNKPSINGDAMWKINYFLINS